MRSRVSIPVLALLLASLLTPAAMAQRNPSRDRQLLLVMQYVVQPSKAAEFEAVAKDAVKQLAQQKSNAGGFLCTRSNEVVYTYILPVSRIADARTEFDALTAAGEALGSQWAERAKDAIEYVNAYLVVARPVSTGKSTAIARRDSFDALRFPLSELRRTVHCREDREGVR